MRRVLICCCVVLMAGCHQNTQKVIARIDNYSITQEEFEEAYKNSVHNPATRLQSRQDFLNKMIDQKLILRDAELHGLDKNKEFLKMVENFWQQSLLTLALKEKSREGMNLDQWVTSLREKADIQINQEYVQ